MIDRYPFENITIQDLVKFVVDNRRGKAFDGWTEKEIARTLYYDYVHFQLAICTNEQNTEIVGLVHGAANHSMKRFHVSNLLVKEGEKGVVSKLLTIFDKQFPGYKLEGTRYGEVKFYDTSRFKRHLNNLT